MEPNSEGRASSAATAGAWLRNARQQRGLHIAALAVMLKVPQAKLEALEADRHDLLPDATFARALATAMCRALKVDPAPVLALLPRTNEQGFDVRPGLNQPFRERGAGSPIDGGVRALLGRPVVWGALLILVAAAAVYWVPAGWVGERESVASMPAFPASGVVAVASAPVEFLAASSTPAFSQASAPAPAPMPVASAPLQVREVAPPPAAASATAPAPEKTAVAVAPGGALRVTATAVTWVEVVDAQGQTLLSRVLREGEQQEYSGAAPYKVRVGNVSGTRIEWRGAAVDLGARGKDNVARLELN
ncbi:helix-turn-helix domain-containing protein [Roseateles sp.]|uniref:helix-turn-helix domain-containing protein n=1 Tax=Roseateles sp. TaxID=1971397 RepID=UPI0025EEF113|nr:helix-turn-helix domain-containing protein [Roseateles sp.]MBV8033569.1 helix-turn-helix domain-containing protein [Roseateles sp.]